MEEEYHSDDSSCYSSESADEKVNRISFGGNKPINLSFNTLQSNNRKEIEEEKLQIGDEMKIEFILPDGTVQSCETQVYSTSDVEQLKTILEEKYSISDVENIELYYNNEVLPDPISLSDIKGIDMNGTNKIKVAIKT